MKTTKIRPREERERATFPCTGCGTKGLTLTESGLHCGVYRAKDPPECLYCGESLEPIARPSVGGADAMRMPGRVFCHNACRLAYITDEDEDETVSFVEEDP